VKFFPNLTSHRNATLCSALRQSVTKRHAIFALQIGSSINRLRFLMGIKSHLVSSSTRDLFHIKSSDACTATHDSAPLHIFLQTCDIVALVILPVPHPCSMLLVEVSRTPALMYSKTFFGVICTMLIMLLGGCHFVSGRACREHATVAFCVTHNVFSSGCHSHSRFHSLRRRRG
jgi:hypothetical protein